MQIYILPAEHLRLVVQCIFYQRQHPSAVAYLDGGTVELFGMIFSQMVLQLCRREAPASNRYRAKEPVRTNTTDVIL